jgi:hypothetical protein
MDYFRTFIYLFGIAVCEIVEAIRSSQLSMVVLVRIEQVLCGNFPKIRDYIIR